MRELCPWRVVLAAGFVALQSWRGAASSNYPDIDNRTFIQQYLDAHNNFRSGVSPAASNMLYMTFDLGLAKIAHAWGQKCISDHNPNREVHPEPKFRPFGENLWFGGISKKPFNPTGPIGAFYNEVKDYDYPSHKCTAVCGHYTQVVWASSYKVGCAVVPCPTMSNGKKNIAILVCNYALAGNYRGVRPYKTGKPCSECAKGDTCENKLCLPAPYLENMKGCFQKTSNLNRNAEREKENSHHYSGWYPPFQTWTTCDAGCISVNVLRISLMFLAFPAAFFLNLQYPDLNLE